MKKIESVAVLKIGTTAQTVAVNGLAFLVQNNSDAAAVYFKEKRADGIAASAQNGYRLGPGASTAIPLTALELSVVADDADTDVRVLLLDEY